MSDTPPLPAYQSHAYQAPAYQPRDLGTALRRVFSLFRAHWKGLLGVSAPIPGFLFLAIALVLGVLFLFAPQQVENPTAYDDPRYSIAIVSVWALMSLFMVPLYSLWVAATSLYTVQLDLEQAVSVRDAYRRAWRRIGRYSLLYLLILLIIGSFLVVTEVAFAFGIQFVAHAGPGSIGLYSLIPLLVLAFLASIVFFVLAGLRLSLAFAAGVSEDLPAWQSIQRSYRLTRGAMGRIFVSLLLIYIVSYAVILAIELLAIALVAVFVLLGGGGPPHGATLILAAVVAGIFFVPLICIYMALTHSGFCLTLAVLYNDQRVRLDLLSASAPVVPAPLPGPPPHA